MAYEDEFLSPHQIAKMAGCSYATVLNHINAGKLQALRMGGNYAVHVQDAVRWVELGGEEVSAENLALLERRVVAVREALARQQGAA